MVVEDGTTGQNTYDFLLVLLSNFGRISYQNAPHLGAANKPIYLHLMQCVKHKISAFL